MNPEDIFEILANIDPASVIPMVANVFVGVLVGMALLFVLSVVLQILYSVGLYTVAQRRGIRHPWMAFVPLTELWLLGSIADQYQYVAKGQVRNRRKTVLWLAISIIVLATAIYGLYIGMIVVALREAAAVILPVLQAGGTVPVDLAELAAVENVILSIAPWLFVAAALIPILSVVLMVYRYICCYNVLRSCRPKLSVLFLILGILCYPLLQLFIFICRNKDNGMPPRKAEVQQESADEPPVQPESAVIPEPVVTGEPEVQPVPPAEPETVPEPEVQPVPAEAEAQPVAAAAAESPEEW